MFIHDLSFRRASPCVPVQKVVLGHICFTVKVWEYKDVSPWSLIALWIPSLRGLFQCSHCGGIPYVSKPFHDFALVIKSGCTIRQISLGIFSPLFVNFCQHDCVGGGNVLDDNLYQTKPKTKNIFNKDQLTGLILTTV